MVTEKMGRKIIQWDMEGDFSIKVSIDGGKWFYPKEDFFKSDYLPPKLKQAYKDIVQEKHNKYKGL